MLGVSHPQHQFFISLILNSSEQGGEEKMGKRYYGYLPPKSFNFRSADEALANFSAAVCAAEFSRFQYLLRKRLASCESEELKRFIPAYLMIDLANGAVESDIFLGREEGAFASQVAWANAMLDFAAFFRAIGQMDPVRELERRSLIIRVTKDSFEPNVKEIQKMVEAI